MTAVAVQSTPTSIDTERPALDAVIAEIDRIMRVACEAALEHDEAGLWRDALCIVLENLYRLRMSPAERRQQITRLLEVMEDDDTIAHTALTSAIVARGWETSLTRIADETFLRRLAK